VLHDRNDKGEIMSTMGTLLILALAGFFSAGEPYNVTTNQTVEACRMIVVEKGFLAENIICFISDST